MHKRFDTTLKIRVPRHLSNRLRLTAEHQCRVASDVVRVALTRYLDEMAHASSGLPTDATGMHRSAA